MNTEEYMEKAGRTDDRPYAIVQERMGKELNSKLLHYALGMCTEAGEIQDQLKKHLIYGKPLDRTNLIEEIGDSLWYQARMLKALGSNFEEAMELNIKKLKARYSDKFTEEAALNRDLKTERDILEDKCN